VKEETKAQPQLKTSVPAVEKKSTPAPVQQQNNIAVNNKKQQQEPSIQQPQQQLQSQEAIVKTEKNPGTNGNNLPTTTVPLQTSIANASSVSYVNNNEDAGDENEQQGLLNENTQRSTGLKALIKKAKRTLERRTGIQSGESQVRFAVFAINTQ
jgi:spore germination protein YaaH